MEYIIVSKLSKEQVLSYANCLNNLRTTSSKEKNKIFLI